MRVANEKASKNVTQSGNVPNSTKKVLFLSVIDKINSMASLSVRRLNKFLNSSQLNAYVDGDEDEDEDLADEIAIESGQFAL